MDKNLNFIQQNSPDGGFLQSEQWRNFQEATGKKTFNVSGENFWANIIEHQLPIVGKYFYISRGPLGESKIGEIIKLAKKEKAGWIRIDTSIKNGKYKIVKAPHDMQPKELFILDITKSEDELLAEMKSKTRYNIKVAEKKNVRIIVSSEKKYLDKFCELVEITSKRQGIVPHPRSHYQKMIEIIPSENIKLYCAEFEGEIIAANLVIFFGDTATYLHGASDDRFRNVMAPYLLQWRQIQDAKKFGATKYDFGGVKIDSSDNSWAGITRFKLSFSPNTKPVEFSGSYDIILNSKKYYLYRSLQYLKGLV